MYIRKPSLCILVLLCTGFINGCSQAATTVETSSTVSSKIWESGLGSDENVLMRVRDENRMTVFSHDNYKILGNDSINTNRIVSVTFLSTLDDMPSDAWNVSANGDGSVMAWVVEDETTLNNEPAYQFYIAGEGGVNANPDSSYLFAHYFACTSIDFNECFYTSAVTDMSHMFETVCTTLDVSGFDTTNVTDMSGMFCDCELLADLDIKNFDTSNVIDMSGMFQNCTSLESLDLNNYDTSSITDMSYMFYNCSALRHLSIAGFKTNQANTEEMFTGAGVSGNTDILGAVLVFVCTWQFLLAAALALLAAVISIVIIRRRRTKQ